MRAKAIFLSEQKRVPGSNRWKRGKIKIAAVANKVACVNGSLVFL